jgi:hypothetical protein
VKTFEDSEQFRILWEASVLGHTRFILYKHAFNHCTYFIACINFDGFLLRTMPSFL